MDSSGNAAADFGRFLTGFLVLMGIGEWISRIGGPGRRSHSSLPLKATADCAATGDICPCFFLTLSIYG